MATSLVLHPAVRERREPRMSATALAEYLILQPDGQETILHDSRYSRPPIITANGDAMRALRAYNCDPRRDSSSLDMVKVALTNRANQPGTKPKSRDEALRCVEAINLFQRHENALGLRPMALSEPPRFDALDIEGVTLSIHPDVMVAGGFGHVGAGILRVAKPPIPMAASWMKPAAGAAITEGRWPGTWSPCCNSCWKRKTGNSEYRIATFVSLQIFVWAKGLVRPLTMRFD